MRHYRFSLDTSLEARCNGKGCVYSFKGTEISAGDAESLVHTIQRQQAKAGRYIIQP